MRVWQPIYSSTHKPGRPTLLSAVPKDGYCEVNIKYPDNVDVTDSTAPILVSC